MTEYRLIAAGDKVTLAELLPGTIFLHGDDCLAVKSEYQCSNGLIEAFIIDSGEQFWGGVHTAREQHELVVQPMEVVEVVHGRWEKEKSHADFDSMKCTACGGLLLVCWHTDLDYYNYCPNCGAKMDAKEVAKDG